MNANPAPWTVTDLARLAAAALAAGSPAQPNGRIREVPDVRTIRWYTSIGLLDRPAAMRGRTALYGRSHLAQLVAIKRLQAGGLTIAGVQERLLGADADAIEEIAMLPADLDDLDDLGDLDDVNDRTAPATPTGPTDPTAPTAPTDPDGLTAEAAPRGRFWASRAAPRTAAESPAPTEESAPPAPGASAAAAAGIADDAPLVHGLRLAADVTLLLPPGRLPDAAGRAAIAEAARPLLDLLDRLGLTEA